MARYTADEPVDTTVTGTETRTPDDTRTPSPTVSLLYVLGGIVSLAGSVMLSLSTDTANLTRLVADGRIVSFSMSDAQLVEAVYVVQLPLVVGLAVLGLALVWRGGDSVRRSVSG